MRSILGWAALGLLTLSCSARDGARGAATAGSSSTGVPSFTGNLNPGANGSGAEPPGAPATPDDDSSGNSGAANTAPPSAASPPEAPATLPLAPGEPPQQPDAPPAAENPGAMAPPVVAMPPASTAPPAPTLQNVLVFTRTTGFRHDSIEAGVQALQRLADSDGFGLERTEDPADFNDARLARFDAVVWLNTDSEVMTDPARRAFERYIRAGGGYVGVHAASASELGWAWYGQLVGAYFLGHPAVQPAHQPACLGDGALDAG
jgi:hypothetical protein